MAKYKLEYLWLHGYEPAANIRGKTQINTRRQAIYWQNPGTAPRAVSQAQFNR